MRKQIEIAAKMYRCQDTAKGLYKADYTEKIKPYRNVIAGYMKAHKCCEIEAVLGICQDDVIKENGIMVMLFMAAAVELVESK